uniref:Glucagon / GIP / secretin / VIP family domain-containing protein n=1 Tax=Cyprinus carpio TaxID=7962 RepID=A0A8C2BL78_CYPCA
MEAQLGVIFLSVRCSDELGVEQMPVKRHSDAVFTDNYSRLRKKMAAKKYLSSVLSGKRRYGLKRSRSLIDLFLITYSCQVKSDVMQLFSCCVGDVDAQLQDFAIIIYSSLHNLLQLKLS